MTDVADEDVARILGVVSREKHIESLSALRNALKDPSDLPPLSETAIGIDANVFLRLSQHKDAADILDYLATHVAPLILPGQAIQEFWNNQLNAVDTISSGLGKRAHEIQKDLDRIEGEMSEFHAEIQAVLDKFAEDYGHLYDPSTRANTENMLEVLSKNAVVEYAPRTPFLSLAEHRRSTKTPPGFKDGFHGDFFIWLDFLFGLARAERKGAKCSCAVIVTLDRKPDWSRNGVAHPILAAEVAAIFGIPFELWTLDKLALKIEQATTK